MLLCALYQRILWQQLQRWNRHGIKGDRIVATHSDVSCSPIPRSQICDFMPYYTMGISWYFMVFLMQAYICDAAASPLAMNNDMIVGRWASTPTQNPQTVPCWSCCQLWTSEPCFIFTGVLGAMWSSPDLTILRIFWGMEHYIYTYLRAAAPAADPGRIGKEAKQIGIKTLRCFAP